MQIQISPDYETLSRQVALEVLATVQSNAAAVLCLATGDTPRLAYQLLAEMSIRAGVSFSQCTFIGLDEWVGIPPEMEGSCRFFLQQHLFIPLGIPELQVHLFNGMSANLADECTRVGAAIKRAGGIDLMLVGVGMNGHIGFNEPGVPADLDAHVITLDETTRSVGQKYFRTAASIGQGITLGLRQVLQSRRLILMANGTKKAEIVRKALEEEVSINIPATLMRTHPNAVAMIDRQAAGLLNPQN
jgi:glucosamine-6-phosphate isomerase